MGEESVGIRFRLPRIKMPRIKMPKFKMPSLKDIGKSLAGNLAFSIAFDQLMQQLGWSAEELESALAQGEADLIPEMDDSSSDDDDDEDSVGIRFRIRLPKIKMPKINM